MKTNEPVITNGSAAAVGAALVPVLIEAGVQSEAAGRAGSFVGASLAFVLVCWHLWSARSKVTPVANLHYDLRAPSPTPAPVGPTISPDEAVRALTDLPAAG